MEQGTGRPIPWQDIEEAEAAQPISAQSTLPSKVREVSSASVESAQHGTGEESELASLEVSLESIPARSLQRRCAT